MKNITPVNTAPETLDSTLTEQNGVSDMERLTGRNEMGGAYYPKCFKEPCLGMGDCVDMNCEQQYDVCEKLAAYEDTGLTPEEIMDGKMLTGWTPVEERLPKTEDGYAHVMVSMDDGFVCTTDYTDKDGFELWADSGEVLAWMPLPEPYRPEDTMTEMEVSHE